MTDHAYIVWDTETNTILAVDQTLHGACSIRAALTTTGTPRVARQAPGDREGGPAERDDRGMVTL